MTALPIEYQSSRPHHKSWGILWLPDEDIAIKGVVQICHGMCEYIERYADFAAWLCSKGYAVCGNDHVGHKNTALLTSQRLGYFGGMGRWPGLVEDVELLRKKLEPRFQGLPWVMLGHSMGSFIARLYAAKYGRELSALILSGTGGKNPALGGAKAMAGTLVAYKGPMHVSRALDNMVNGMFNKKIDHPRTLCDWISRDEAIVNRYVNDTYCTFKFTASAYHDLFEMMEQCNRSQWFTKLPKDLPVLVFSGDEDPVGSYGKGPRQVVARLTSAGVTNVTLQLYPGGRHEMLNEVNRKDVYQDIYNWMNEEL